VTARAVGLLMLVATLVGCGPLPHAGTKPIIGHVGGRATYQTIVGGRAEVQVYIRDFDRQVPHVVLTFVGESNWLLQHGSITNDLSACQIGKGRLDCGAISTLERENIFFRGVATRAGVFQYTLAVSSENDGHLEPIHAADGGPLIMRWVEVVNAP
jgi:hypothetical protein